MTVISNLLTNRCVVHSSDSFLTILEKNDQLRVVESLRPKIVAIRHFRGAISFCGYAGRQNSPMLDWLAGRCRNAFNFDTPDLFSDWLAQELNTWIRTVPAQFRGLKMHFTAYEDFGFGRVPELFSITNWDGAYRVLERVTSQRQTILTITNNSELPVGEQPDITQRTRVNEFLQRGLIRYNDGDLELFNALANAMIDSVGVLQDRRDLVTDPVEFAGRLALMPVEAVCNIQRWLGRVGRRGVGGRPHNLIITPDGQFSSMTGLRLIPGT
ncbi:MAG: hypothetical protein KIT34_18860 [Cyanobacteria bacterium TGS_CYA1]|nr:hypothetical protein [Cyanobacteria bacterium TGS_CYA1]